MNTSDKINYPARTIAQTAVLSYLDKRVSRSADHIRTHSAHIFLIDAFAYKIKSDIKYSYLDMTSLHKRKKLCERELELNSPSLPDIYLEVVPITIDDNNVMSINGPGSVVEWALKMNRFSEQKVMDNIAVQGELDAAIAKQMGRSLARYHEILPSLNVQDGHLRIKEVYEEIRDEFKSLDTVISEKELVHFQCCGAQALQKCQSHLDQRARDGFIKRCHGDLHLRNILMTESGPVPFDALEFDERMASTDVLYDIAFLLMDMIHRGMTTQTNVLLNAYLLYSSPEQCEGLLHLPLFLYARAAIRAMTTAQAAKQQSQGSLELPGMIDEARKYLSEANAYLQEPKPRLVVIAGLSGTGKSSVSTAIATRLGHAPGAILLGSDTERKKMFGVDETDRLPASHYTHENSLKVYKQLFYKAQMVLDSGMPVIIDAVFHEEQQRIQAQGLALRANVPFTGCWLEAPLDRLNERISQRYDDASDADTQVLRQQLLKATGFINWSHIDASGTLGQSIDNVIKELGSFA